MSIPPVLICYYYPLPPYCYRSSTFVDSNKKVKIGNSQGGFTGYLGSDRLWFISFNISDVSVAIIEKSWNFFGTDPQWQGILGLAFDSLMKVTIVTKHYIIKLVSSGVQYYHHIDDHDILPCRASFREISMRRISNLCLTDRANKL